jgi:hypothetical protein
MTAVKIVIPVPTTSSRKLAELSGISQHGVVQLKSAIAKRLYRVSQPFKEIPAQGRDDGIQTTTSSPNRLRLPGSSQSYPGSPNMML